MVESVRVLSKAKQNGNLEAAGCIFWKMIRHRVMAVTGVALAAFYTESGVIDLIREGAAIYAFSFNAATLRRSV
jgi:hypothetical protein